MPVATQTNTEDTTAARDEMWTRFSELGAAKRLDELGKLFRAGSSSVGIDGPTEGQLVTFTAHPLFDRVAATITGAWMPWAGKRFDSATNSGDNLLARSAKWPARLPWPTYPMRDAGDRLAAFDFETRVEPGKLDPETDVLVIDYAPVDSNPRLVIKQVRDELVEVVPGAHLGKMLWHHGEDRYSLAAYFALKS